MLVSAQMEAIGMKMREKGVKTCKNSQNVVLKLVAGQFQTIKHYLKVCAGKPDCTETKMNWVISILEQSGFPTHTPVLCSIE